MLEDIRDAVYGVLYESAQTQMRMAHDEVINHKGGFDSYEACARWAKENLCDIVAYSKSQKQYYYLTHYGVILTKSAWCDHYRDVLYVSEEDKNGEEKHKQWIPQGVQYLSKARVISEANDGPLQPLYHRDYFTPAGYYDPTKGTFNVAHPFPVPAKKTNRDTSHIYTLIEHISDGCGQWVLAWLRTKMLYPMQKTQVVPVFVSRAQGTGKTTFAEVICRGLFGKHNVLVTDQYDSQSRFNSDYADALIVCHEEKEEVDRRNPAATIKSRATATTIRKENKGLDPIYQDSYTEFIMTSNKDVPIKFDDQEDQRRFMIMEADDTFTRKNSELADEVFTKLYGRDADSVLQGIPFTEDNDLIAQFKHELAADKALDKIKLRSFPQTDAYKRCYTLPRTSEAAEVESILRSLVPFIKASLLEGAMLTQVQDEQQPDQLLSLSNIILSPGALQYIPPTAGNVGYVAICRPLVFYDRYSSTNKPMAHAMVERSIYDCAPWLQREFGLMVLKHMGALPGGFMNVQGVYRSAAAARIALYEDRPRLHIDKEAIYNSAGWNVTPAFNPNNEAGARIGERLRVNGKWVPDPNGEYETVNEMKPGTTTLENKNTNVQYLDTFLFEADETTKAIYMIEESRIQKRAPYSQLRAEVLFAERLRTQRSEAERLYKSGIACRVVYSGGKSYHVLVRIKDAPRTLEEYKWLHAHLCLQLSDKVIFDISTSDPGRLTRAPILYERTFDYGDCVVVGQQKLLLENWGNVYDYNWRVIYQQWLNRPLYDFEAAKGKRLIPTKPEYRDAMYALVRGIFWTDSTWNGRRQQCFFPGYRLCRLLGYTHEELWSDDGIMSGIENYYRKNEIQYWRSRETSEIIRQIDAAVDAQIQDQIDEVNNEQ